MSVITMDNKKNIGAIVPSGYLTAVSMPKPRIINSVRIDKKWCVKIDIREGVSPLKVRK